jgi:signal transduction histidine kinase
MSEHSLTTSSPASHPSLPLRYAAGVAAVLLASLLVFWIVMQPPLNEVGWVAVFLSGTALLSIILGYTAYRAGWLNRAPTLRWALLGGYALSSLLTFLNVWVTARLMFASRHDLVLATILLIFASGIAMALGLFLSGALVDRIRLVDGAAQAISRGELDVRVDPQGRDEIAALANTFNEMAVQLQATDRKQRELESLRRDLIAWVSHDLQTPLSSMRAMVEALADGVVSDLETERRYLATLQKEIRELSALIDDLFQMAQLDAGGLALDCELSSMTDLLSDTFESFSALASQRGIDLVFAPTPGVDVITMDTRRIGRVLNNLIGNAIHHTPKGGRVWVTAGRVSGGVRVEVADSGEGIPAEDLPYVFDRFYRGEKSRNRATGGAGLGLAIARGIVEAHGGTIAVESRPGEATRFFFTLPDHT